MNYIESLYTKRAEAVGQTVEAVKMAAIAESLQRANAALQTGQPVLIDVYDKTNAARQHVIPVLAVPREQTAYVGIPTTSGEYPTMLHGLESLSQITTVNQQSEEPIQNIVFQDARDIRRKKQELGQIGEHILLPMTINPHNTHMLVFHGQARSRHIDPQAVGKRYWQELRTAKTPIEWPAHTMLVSHKEHAPSNKHHVIVAFNKNGSVRREGYELIHPKRIDVSKMRAR